MSSDANSAATGGGHLFDLDTAMKAIGGDTGGGSGEDVMCGCHGSSSSHGLIFNGSVVASHHGLGGSDIMAATSSSPTKSSFDDSSNDHSSPEKTSKQQIVGGSLHHHQHRFHRGQVAVVEGDDDMVVDQHVAKLFVGNLPTTTTLPELLNVFRQYGPINERLSVVKDHNYAFIHFFNRQDAERALAEVNDSLFKDRYIRVQFSTSQGFSKKPKNKSSFSSAGSDIDVETASSSSQYKTTAINHPLLNSKSTGFKSMYDFQTTNNSFSQSYRPIIGGGNHIGSQRVMSHSNTTMFNQFNHRLVAPLTNPQLTSSSSSQISCWPNHVQQQQQPLTSTSDLAAKKQHQIIQAFYMKQEQRQKQEQQQQQQQQLFQQQLLYHQLMSNNSLNNMRHSQSGSGGGMFDSTMGGASDNKTFSSSSYWPNINNKFK